MKIEMSRKQHTVLMLLILCTLLIVDSFVPVAAKADRCSELEKEGLLLSQQFKKNKVCRESNVGKGWTDCLFKAGNTEILLVGAIGRSIMELMTGFFGSGFYINSVDPNVKVRTFVDEDLGLVISVTAKDILIETGCLYNQAYITLDARVLDNGEFNKIKYGPMDKPKKKGPKERTMDAQENLKYLGYQPGPIDGLLGPQTKAAIEAYKRDNGLEPSMPDEEVFSLIGGKVLLRMLEELRELYEEMDNPKLLFK